MSVRVVILPFQQGGRMTRNYDSVAHCTTRCERGHAVPPQSRSVRAGQSQQASYTSMPVAQGEKAQSATSLRTYYHTSTGVAMCQRGGAPRHATVECGNDSSGEACHTGIRAQQEQCSNDTNRVREQWGHTCQRRRDALVQARQPLSLDDLARRVHRAAVHGVVVILRLKQHLHRVCGQAQAG